jgi:hypothetical protein
VQAPRAAPANFAAFTYDLDCAQADAAMARDQAVRRGELGRAVVLLRRAQRLLAGAELDLLARIRAAALAAAARKGRAA